MANSIRLFVRESWLLIVSSFLFGLLLAVTDAAWSPRIVQNELNKFNKLAAALFGKEGTTFEPIEGISLNSSKGQPIPVDVRKAMLNGQCIGWAFMAEGSGFAGPIRLVVAADAGFEKILGFGTLVCNETPGFGDKIKIRGGFYEKQYQGAPVGPFALTKAGDPAAIDSTIVAITGATVTSDAVVAIFNRYAVAIQTQMKAKGLLSHGQ
ncbi:MAG: FMN-binding protein [Phycisphaerae bacterium]|nr:FMN-binding protein [Phycisphaerae bacterium]